MSGVTISYAYKNKHGGQAVCTRTLGRVVARLLTISNEISQNSDYLYAYQQVDLML